MSDQTTDAVEELAKAIAFEWLSGGTRRLSVVAFERAWAANLPEWDAFRAECRALAEGDPIRHMNVEAGR